MFIDNVIFIEIKKVAKELFTLLFAHMIVSGRVQGVGFRFSAQQKALEFHLTGWVRNKIDGTVEIEVEGEKEKVEQFIQQIEKGFHKFMHVDHIELKKSETLRGYKKFVIK